MRNLLPTVPGAETSKTKVLEDLAGSQGWFLVCQCPFLLGPSVIEGD